jgi:hypothetical protein
MAGVRVSKFWVAAIAGALGVGLGLMIAKAYAQNVVQSDISNVLGKVGLAGGVVEKTIDSIIVPQV